MRMFWLGLGIGLIGGFFTCIGLVIWAAKNQNK